MLIDELIVISEVCNFNKISIKGYFSDSQEYDIFKSKQQVIYILKNYNIQLNGKENNCTDIAKRLNLKPRTVQYRYNTFKNEIEVNKKLEEDTEIIVARCLERYKLTPKAIHLFQKFEDIFEQIIKLKPELSES